MKASIYLIFLLLFSTAGHPDNRRCPNGLPVFGAYEVAILDSIDALKVETLVDSGAMTTALDAKNIRMHVNRRGERWVYYDFLHKPTNKKVSKHQLVSRVIRVITHSGTSSSRPVVAGTVSVGSVQRTVDMSLINRSNFPQQLLLGRNYLENTALIDSGKSFLQTGS